MTSRPQSGLLADAAEHMLEYTLLWHAAWHQAFPERVHPDAFAMWQQRFADICRTQQVRGMRVEHRLAGFISWLPERRYIDQLGIHPLAQRRGLGAKLAGHVIAELGAVSLDCWAINERGLAFYLALGFRVVGRRPHSVLPGEEFVVMRHGPE